MKVGYSKTYPISSNGTWEKIWLEDEIASGSEEETRKTLYALKRQVEKFHYESNAAAEKQSGTKVIELHKDEVTFNQEWEDVKSQLLSFDNAEAAQQYLNTTGYALTIEAKQIINQLKNKNEPKY